MKKFDMTDLCLSYLAGVLTILIVLGSVGCTSTKAVPDYGHGRYERRSDNLKHN